MTRIACYSVAACPSYWFWATWHNLGECWFGDAPPFAYGRAQSRLGAIAQAEEALGNQGQMTHERFAAQWWQKLGQRQPRGNPQMGTRHRPNEPAAACAAPPRRPQSSAYWLRAHPKYIIPLQTLALQWPFTRQELTAAYRQKLRETHPDLGGTSEALIAVCDAYQLLKTALEQELTHSG